MQIKNRTFIISGGSSGLGLGTANALLSAGANVSILDINPPPTSSNHILYTKTDVSSSDSIFSAVKATISWCQSTSYPLSGCICSAGIGTAALAVPKQASTASHDNLKYYDMAAFDRTVAINFRGTVDLIRLTLPHMSLNEPWGPDGERGIVIVVSSTAAYEGQVGQLAYSASKGAVRSIVLPLARELGQKHGIRVLGIAPGAFETGMTMPKDKPKQKQGGPGPSAVTKDKPRDPTGQRAMINPEMLNYPSRMGKADEFAGLVKHMIENPMLNGDVVRLDGGIRMPSRL